MAAVIPLPISFPWEVGQQTLFPTLLLDGSDAVLIDCGYPGWRRPSAQSGYLPPT